MILDFSSGTDKIQLSKSVFNKWTAELSTISRDDFVAPTTGIVAGQVPTPVDGSDKILYNKIDGSLWYDPDGKGPTGTDTVPVKIAILGNTITHTDLQYSDIQIIA